MKKAINAKTLKKALHHVELKYQFQALNEFNENHNTTFTINDYVVALSENDRKKYFLHADLSHMLQWDHVVKKEFIRWAICNNHTAKMRDMASCSTSCKCNENCQEHAKIPGSVCVICYAQNQLEYQRSTDDHYRQCYIFFTSVTLTIEDIPIINRVWFRIEAFGDIDNERQQKNYMLLAVKNPHCTFVQWTKNPWIIEDALKTANKPDNYFIILSSMFLNKSFTKEQLQRAGWLGFTDAVFTVYTDEYIDEHDIKINCGSNECISCLRCYTLDHGQLVYINERKK